MTNDKRTIQELYEELICSLDFGGNITIRDASVEATNKMYKKFYGILSAERRRADEWKEKHDAQKRGSLKTTQVLKDTIEQRDELQSRLKEAELKAKEAVMLMEDYRMKLSGEDVLAFDRLEGRVQEAEAENLRLLQQGGKFEIAHKELEKELASAKELWADAQSACKKHDLRADELEKEVATKQAQLDSLMQQMMTERDKACLAHIQEIKELEKEVERLRKDDLDWCAVNEETENLKSKIKELESRLSEKDKLIEWHKQDTHTAMEWKRDLEAELFRHKAVVEAAKKLPELECKNVGNFKQPHCEVCGFYEALASLDGDKLQGGENVHP